MHALRVGERSAGPERPPHQPACRLAAESRNRRAPRRSRVDGESSGAAVRDHGGEATRRAGRPGNGNSGRAGRLGEEGLRRGHRNLVEPRPASTIPCCARRTARSIDCGSGTSSSTSTSPTSHRTSWPVRVRGRHEPPAPGVGRDHGSQHCGDAGLHLTVDEPADTGVMSKCGRDWSPLGIPPPVIPPSRHSHLPLS